MKAKTPGTPVVSKDAMSGWVTRNLDFLEDAEGPSGAKQMSTNSRSYLTTLTSPAKN
jgi:hypothetical protein